jgi:UDP-N-acetylmuramoyl-tripeptide--D-alanyl-D-alanine ligase
MIKDLYDRYLECDKTITTDTRKISKGGLFLALKGENFDGNDYIEEALEKGAAHAISSRSEFKSNDRVTVVEDTLLALQHIANDHRKQFDIPVLGITGSNGKTTSKELITAVLSKKFITHSTPGNFNNHIGLPLTLLSMKSSAEFCVLEMGDNHPGEIKLLCEIGAPTHGLVTNVGKDHIEGFGSFEANKLAKKELFDYLAIHQCTAFIPEFEEELIEMSGNVSDRSTFGLNECIQMISAQPLIKYRKPSGEIATTQLIGDYNFRNILMAYHIGKYFDVPEEDIHHAITSYVPSNNRSQLIKKGNNLVFLDAYNSNPSSAELAIQNLLMQNTELKKIAILGDMLELGDESIKEHQGIVDLLNGCGIEVILVGTEFEKTIRPKDFKHFSDRHKLIEQLNLSKPQNAMILIKGSRGLRLEETLEAL